MEHKIAKFAKLSQEAIQPVRMSKGAAGFDLFSAEEVALISGQTKVVMTDIAMQPPEGTYIKVSGRSGLAVNNAIFVHVGIIDEDYRGNIGVVMINLSKKAFLIRKGMRIGQAIFQPYHQCQLEEVAVADLEPTERMDCGFGSTGLN